MTFISSSSVIPKHAFRLLDYIETQTYRAILGKEGVNYVMLDG